MDGTTPPHDAPGIRLAAGARASGAPLIEAGGLWLTVPARPVRVNRGNLFRRRVAADEAQPPLDILRGVSLSVAAGESVGLVGPSGSGKTSLLMLLAGLEQPTRGTVRIGGTDLGALDEDGRARFRGREVGIVFQSFHLIGTMTALENVAIPLELAGEADALDRAEAALRSVGLGHRLGHRPAEMSGGEQQRVALARAFAPEPRLLLADEPTGNLDTATGEAVAALMLQMQRERGTTLFLITHDPALAARCGRTLSIADGQLAGSGGR